MPRRIVALPRDGIPGTFEEDDGARVQGVYHKVAYVYDPGEVAPACRTLGELKAKYWSAASRSLVIPFANSEFSFGAELLGQTSDSTLICLRTEFSYRPVGANP